ncbi:hypothetical protein G7Y89_g10656 [Cudoniella acicularis]|uniref:Zn(2)-C6 fungal-type domain-containing protein n=1 Tax=Cudoniella acicularis TaxID=354080 RepID=A0A8H4RDV9_9HELO|nr:hypothetical protein G7Y89_g10656 [Cudoniella acicularis]
MWLIMSPEEGAPFRKHEAETSMMAAPTSAPTAMQLQLQQEMDGRPTQNLHGRPEDAEWQPYPHTYSHPRPHRHPDYEPHGFPAKTHILELSAPSPGPFGPSYDSGGIATTPFVSQIWLPDTQPTSSWTGYHYAPNGLVNEDANGDGGPPPSLAAWSHDEIGSFWTSMLPSFDQALANAPEPATATRKSLYTPYTDVSQPFRADYMPAQPCYSPACSSASYFVTEEPLLQRQHYPQNRVQSNHPVTSGYVNACPSSSLLSPPPTREIPSKSNPEVKTIHSSEVDHKQPPSSPTPTRTQEVVAHDDISTHTVDASATSEPPCESKWNPNDTLSKPQSRQSAVPVTISKRKRTSPEPAPKKSRSGVTQKNISEFVLVFENAPGALSSVKHRRKLDAPVRKAARDVRKAGACHQCRFRKRTCSTGTPCVTCLKNGNGLHELKYFEHSSTKRIVTFAIDAPIDISAETRCETITIDGIGRISHPLRLSAHIRKLNSLTQKHQDIVMQTEILGRGSTVHSTDTHVLLLEDYQNLGQQIEQWAIEYTSKFVHAAGEKFYSTTMAQILGTAYVRKGLPESPLVAAMLRVASISFVLRAAHGQADYHLISLRLVLSTHMALFRSSNPLLLDVREKHNRDIIGNDEELMNMAMLMRKVVMTFSEKGFPEMKGSIAYRKEYFDMFRRVYKGMLPKLFPTWVIFKGNALQSHDPAPGP